MKINVALCVAIAERRLDGHPITISEQVAVCDLLLAYYKAQPSDPVLVSDSLFEEAQK